MRRTEEVHDTKLSSVKRKGPKVRLHEVSYADRTVGMPHLSWSLILRLRRPSLVRGGMQHGWRPPIQIDPARTICLIQLAQRPVRYNAVMARTGESHVVSFDNSKTNSQAAAGGVSHR